MFCLELASHVFLKQQNRKKNPKPEKMDFLTASSRDNFVNLHGTFFTHIPSYAGHFSGQQTFMGLVFEYKMWFM